MANNRNAHRDAAYRKFLEQSESALIWIRDQHQTVVSTNIERGIDRITAQHANVDKLVNEIKAHNPNQPVDTALNTAKSLLDDAHPSSSDIRQKLDELKETHNVFKKVLAERWNKLRILLGTIKGAEFLRLTDTAIDWMSWKQELIEDTDYPEDKASNDATLLNHTTFLESFNKFSRRIRVLQAMVSSCLIEELSEKTLEKLGPSDICDDSREENLVIETALSNLVDSYKSYQEAISRKSVQILRVYKRLGLLNRDFELQGFLLSLFNSEIDDCQRWMLENTERVSLENFLAFVNTIPDAPTIEEQLEKIDEFRVEVDERHRINKECYAAAKLFQEGNIGISDFFREKSERCYNENKLFWHKTLKLKSDLMDSLTISRAIEFLERAKIVDFELDQKHQFVESDAYDDCREDETSKQIYHEMIDLDDKILKPFSQTSVTFKLWKRNFHFIGRLQQKQNSVGLTEIEQEIIDLFEEQTPNLLQEEMVNLFKHFDIDIACRDINQQQSQAVDKVISLLKEKHGKIMILMEEKSLEHTTLVKAYEIVKKFKAVDQWVTFLEENSNPWLQYLIEYHVTKDSWINKIKEVTAEITSIGDTHVLRLYQVEALAARWDSLEALYDAKKLANDDEKTPEEIVLAKQQLKRYEDWIKTQQNSNNQQGQPSSENDVSSSSQPVSRKRRACRDKEVARFHDSAHSGGL